MGKSKIQPSPDFSQENALGGRVAGVDEAGRGPLAGPVVAAAVVLNPAHIPSGISDSKTLSPAKLESVREQIIKSGADIGIGIAEPEDIDRLNIRGATFNAMRRAIEGLGLSPDHALIDGNGGPELSMPSHHIIKGDQKSLSIAAASIIAKTQRDRLMRAMDVLYPEYEFARHKAYPTAAHSQILSQSGPCRLHRLGFSPVHRAAKAHGFC